MSDLREIEKESEGLKGRLKERARSLCIFRALLESHLGHAFNGQTRAAAWHISAALVK